MKDRGAEGCEEEENRNSIDEEDHVPAGIEADPGSGDPGIGTPTSPALCNHNDSPTAVAQHMGSAADGWSTSRVGTKVCARAGSRDPGDETQTNPALYGAASESQDTGKEVEEWTLMLCERPVCRLCVSASGTFRCVSCAQYVCGECAGQDLTGRIRCKTP